MKFCGFPLFRVVKKKTVYIFGPFKTFICSSVLNCCGSFIGQFKYYLTWSKGTVMSKKYFIVNIGSKLKVL